MAYMRAFQQNPADDLARILAEAQALSSGEGEVAEDDGIEDDTEGTPDPRWFSQMEDVGKVYGGLKKRIGDVTPVTAPPKLPRYDEPQEKLPNRKVVAGMDFAAAVAHILANRKRRKHGQRTTPMQAPIGTIALARREREHRAAVSDVQAKNKALEIEEARMGAKSGEARESGIRSATNAALGPVLAQGKGPKDTEATRSRHAMEADIEAKVNSGRFTPEQGDQAVADLYGLDANKLRAEVKELVDMGVDPKIAKDNVIKRNMEKGGSDSIDPRTRAFETMAGQHEGRMAGFDKPESFMDILYRERQHLRGDIRLQFYPDQLEAKALENATRYANMLGIQLPPGLPPPAAEPYAPPFDPAKGVQVPQGAPPPTAAPPQVGGPPGRDFATEGHLRHEGGRVIFPEEQGAPAPTAAPPRPQHSQLPPQAKLALPMEEKVAAARRAKAYLDEHEDEAGAVWANFQKQYGEDGLALLGVQR